MKSESATAYAAASKQAAGLLKSIESKIATATCSGLPFSGSWEQAEQMADICRQLREIEDRLYGKGEYAPENAAR